ncbi:NB-ARC domain-containing protein [Streptomyces albidoflavus]
MEAELGAVAVSGATALVGLIVSEGFERAKSGLARILRRRTSGAGDEEELQGAREELERARAADDSDAEAGVRERLGRMLEDVFREDAGAAEELAQLLSQVAPEASRTFVSLVSGGVNHGPLLQGSPVHGGIHYHAAPAPPPTPGQPVRPDQVPLVVGPFSNRTEEIAVWEARLEGRAGGSPRVSLDVLDGLPGVGKTAMAWRCAELAEGWFPGGHLYVDFAALRGQGTSGADVCEALAMCLRSLPGDGAEIPDTLYERANLFRTRTRDLRILLVLDDVDQAAQVQPLIPNGPGSAVLVTTRQRFGALAQQGARLISIKPLDAHGGLALLTDRCGAEAVEAEREAALRLVELCGGLPVALQVVAARLVTGVRPTMAQLAVELEDEAGRLDALALDGQESAVAVALEPSYRLLPPDAARLYRLLGRLPFGTFDVGVTAVVADLDARTARRLLSVLIQACLVEVTRDGRYRMHDLVRLHARTHADAEERATERLASTERLTRHYLALTAFADLALRRERLRVADLTELLRGAEDPFSVAGGPSPLEWLHTERSAILGMLREAVRHELYTLAWRLAEVFAVFFLHHRYLRAWVEAMELGVEAAAAAAVRARTAGEIEEATAGEARLRALLSRPLLDLRENDRAGEQLTRAIALAETTDRLALHASVQEFFGRYLDIVDPQEAVEVYQRSLVLNERAEESRGAALVTFFLGCALDARGDHEEAMVLLLQAQRELAERTEPDRRMAARVKAAIGVTQGNLGDTAQAVRTLREACGELAKVAKAMQYEAQTWERLADIAERAADEELVRESLARAAEVYEARGSLDLAEEVRRRLDGLDN